MMFERLLQVMDRACERPTLNTPSSVAKRSFGGLEIFDGSKPMILPLSIERPIPYAGLQRDGHGPGGRVYTKYKGNHYSLYDTCRVAQELWGGSQARILPMKTAVLRAPPRP